MIDSMSDTETLVNLGSQTTKFCCLISNHPSFNIALAIHVYDNAVAFRPHDFAANEISTP